jgi:hypothetical protein
MAVNSTTRPGLRRIPLERIIVAGAVAEANVSLAAENDNMAAALAAAMTHISTVERENTSLRQLTAALGRAVNECAGAKL